MTLGSLDGNSKIHVDLFFQEGPLNFFSQGWPLIFFFLIIVNQKLFHFFSGSKKFLSLFFPRKWIFKFIFFLLERGLWDLFFHGDGPSNFFFQFPPSLPTIIIGGPLTLLLMAPSLGTPCDSSKPVQKSSVFQYVEWNRWVSHYLIVVLEWDDQEVFIFYCNKVSSYLQWHITLVVHLSQIF